MLAMSAGLLWFSFIKEGYNMNKFIQYFAVAIFGIAIPVYLMGAVVTNVSAVNQEISYAGSLDSTIESFSEAKKHLKTPNDYALLAMLSAESANQKTMINKQVMKVTVIQIGFAVISIGMLFVVLGFNEGGAEGGASNGVLSFNFKTGSSGLAAIIVGAAMANLGGVLNNAFSTVQVPMFSGVVENSVLPVNSGAPKIKLLAEAVTTCGEQFKTLPNELKQEQLKVCMLARLEGIYGNEN
jgi:hypothetical protein